jgi:hypothetical protein
MRQGYLRRPRRPENALTTIDRIPASARLGPAVAALVAVAVAAAAVALAVSGGSAGERGEGRGEPTDHGWGVGNWPRAGWRPYADSSPWNTPLPDDPRLHPRSDAIVARMTASGGPSDLRAGLADTDGDYQHPTYWSTPEDPVFTIHCTRTFGRCEVEGMRVRIPDRARAAAGSDAHLTVVDQRSGWEYDFWEVTSKPSGGGRLEIGFGGRTRIDGDGLGSDATAAHFGNLAGIIRAQELAAGRIDHALFVIADCDSGEWVYPARGVGARCADPRDAPAEGTRFQLGMSPAEIRALGVPRWKRAILLAMARYGMFVGDTGGTPWDLELESGSTYTSFGYDDPAVTYARRAGIPPQPDGTYPFDVASGVDWRGRLRVIDPCVTRGTC